LITGVATDLAHLGGALSALGITTIAALLWARRCHTHLRVRAREVALWLRWHHAWAVCPERADESWGRCGSPVDRARRVWRGGNTRPAVISTAVEGITIDTRRSDTRRLGTFAEQRSVGAVKGSGGSGSSCDTQSRGSGMGRIPLSLSIAVVERYRSAGDAVGIVARKTFSLHLLGIVLGLFDDEAIRVDTSGTEVCQFTSVSCGLLVGNLSLPGANATLTDAIVEESSNNESTNSSTTGIDTNLGTRWESIPLIREGLLRCRRRRRDSIMSCGITAAGTMLAGSDNN
jgi:hypothetical protein